MAMGRRKSERQAEMWVATGELPQSPGHVFYEKLNDLLAENGFGISRYTSTAREAKKQGLWKKENLPVTLDEAVEGFKSYGHGGAVPQLGKS